MAKRVKPTRKERLQHILDAILKIEKYTAGSDLSAFIDNEMMQLAIIKLFEIMGESSYHIDKEFKSQNDHIEWHKIEGMRHILVHDYYRIQPQIIWNAKDLYLPDLKRDIRNLLKEDN
ncbi:DUF86 domain-containing protein [Neolewinella sp.]|uniref:HepT-like ribonuclease domain-containing protein n=1 Tax=Neolewinella sp. TaxID=2993543 RepID=UPI003B52FF2E